jgi:hypothetical protein
MRITDVTTEVRSVAEVALFYGSVLELPVDRMDANAVTVRIGTTTMRFVENRESLTDHHFAITVPSNKFAEAKSWLASRTPLLSTVEGDEFEFETMASWNARSVYFDGPGRSVLELIVRRDLANETPGDFTSDDLLAVSEVGVATPDVAEQIAKLAKAGILPYGVEPLADFAPVGDIEGMLILVTAGRSWFPTSDRVARLSPITVDAIGSTTGSIKLGGGGGSLRSTAPSSDRA